ncbi:S-adenosyl-L-methionine-dependent methyltransferase [Rozella allomycis CSF55]|uniref:rRNA adenine N(6)-methyltransferase n=1 Tax=Rozella allomycis (strain CSF55) TaxID=988480 RepID=A0A4P9YGX0_ROZAC|nr:S-adenosyl-L-methionine-dependent methyltransferase [Rozella allomycis CSF55]
MSNTVPKIISGSSIPRKIKEFTFPTTKELVDLYKVRATTYTLGPDLSDNFIMEIGAGPGTITKSILNRAIQYDNCKVSLVERDKRFVPIHEVMKECYPENAYQMVYNDILKWPDVENEIINHWNTLQPGYFNNANRVQVIGNLPFNIASPLIISMLRRMSHNEGFLGHPNVDLLLMFQRDVADRFHATPHNRVISRLTIVSQFVCESKIELKLKAGAFTPAPEVDAALVRFKKREKVLDERIEFEELEKVATYAFNNRRKTLTNNFKNIFKDTEKELKELNMNPKDRPEDYDTDKYCLLTRYIKDFYPKFMKAHINQLLQNKFKRPLEEIEI